MRTVLNLSICTGSIHGFAPYGSWNPRVVMVLNSALVGPMDWNNNTRCHSEDKGGIMTTSVFSVDCHDANFDVTSAPGCPGAISDDKVGILATVVLLVIIGIVQVVCIRLNLLPTLDSLFHGLHGGHGAIDGECCHKDHSDGDTNHAQRQGHLSMTSSCFKVTDARGTVGCHRE